MAFHHKIKPHHHVSIWVLMALMVLIAGLVSNTSSLERALAQNSEPSQKTKKFFGFDEGEDEGGWEMPAACNMQTEQTRMQQLSTEMQDLSNQMSTLNQQDSGLSDEQRALNQQKINELQQKMTVLQAEMQTLQSSLQSGPSSACITAMVNQAVVMMEEMLTKMDSRLPSTLTKVEATVAKIESALPGLKTAGVAADQLNKIETNIASIKVQVGVLRSFFTKMKTSMQKFIAEAKANPSTAFTKMQNGGMGMNDTDASQAATAADTMVTAFEELVTILDAIKGEE